MLPEEQESGLKLVLSENAYNLPGSTQAMYQGFNARKVNCGRLYSAYTLKPVLFGRNL